MKSKDAIRIAIADDHPIVTQGLVKFLNSYDEINVLVQVRHGKELIDTIKAMDQPPDVCIVDIKMPVMDGFETVRKIKQLWPGIGVLVLTTFDNELYVVRMIRSGANGYLLKSSEPEEIKTAIEAIYKKGHYYSPTLTKAGMGVLHQQIQEPQLSEKEMQVLKYIGTDLSYAEIGEKIGSSRRSVEGYRDNLFRKLNINSRVGLVLFAVKYGIVQIEGGVNIQ